jgi:hypothetical protein
MQQQPAEGSPADQLLQHATAQSDKADALRNLFTAYNPNFKGATKHLSLEQMEGMLKGYTIQSSMADAQARRQEMQMRGLDYMAQMQLRQQQAEDDLTAGRVMQHLVTGPSVDEQGNPLTFNQQLGRAMALEGSAPGIGRSLPHALDSYIKAQALQERSQQVSDDAQVGRAVDWYNNTPKDNVLAPDPTHQQRMAYMSAMIQREGLRLSPTATTKLLDSINKSAALEAKQAPGADDLAVKFTEDPMTGRRFASLGKVLQESGINPAKAQPQLLPQHDPETGELVGFSSVDAKGHSTFHPYKGPSLTPMIDPDTHQKMPGRYWDQKGTPHDFRDQFQKMGPDATAPESKGFWDKFTGFFKGGGPAATTAPAATVGPAATSTTVPEPGTKKLTPDQAKQFMTQAGGDKVKARQLAAAAGFSF